VKKEQETGLDFEVDKLTNSIENAISGDSFRTEVSLLSKSDLKAITDKDLWLFDWKLELRNPLNEVYKLTIVGNTNIIQGLISIEIKADHVYMHLLESVKFNRGKNKL